MHVANLEHETREAGTYARQVIELAVSRADLIDAASALMDWPGRSSQTMIRDVPPDTWAPGRASSLKAVWLFNAPTSSAATPRWMPYANVLTPTNWRRCSPPAARRGCTAFSTRLV
jgi:hypothetical protein